MGGHVTYKLWAKHKKRRWYYAGLAKTYRNCNKGDKFMLRVRQVDAYGKELEAYPSPNQGHNHDQEQQGTGMSPLIIVLIVGDILMALCCCCVTFYCVWTNLDDKKDQNF